ncbi:MAG: hypothetical protein U9O94_06105 [Nanoarchaeota archaeon]|nr:hypothetical protein [Nanoarchaeota archaeon]
MSKFYKPASEFEFLVKLVDNIIEEMYQISETNLVKNSECKFTRALDIAKHNLEDAQDELHNISMTK